MASVKLLAGEDMRDELIEASQPEPELVASDGPDDLSDEAANQASEGGGTEEPVEVS